MNHLSAHKSEQLAVQDAYARGREDAVNEVVTWLLERSGQLEFAVVEVAFRSDWIAPPEQEKAE